MSDTMENAVGVGATVILNDKPYKLAPITIGMIAEFSAWVRSESIRVFRESAANMDPAERVQCLVELASRAVTEHQVQSYMQSIEGVKYLIYLCLKKNHPDLNYRDTDDMITEQNYQELAVLAESLGGSVDEANPTKSPTAEGQD